MIEAQKIRISKEFVALAEAQPYYDEVSMPALTGMGKVGEAPVDIMLETKVTRYMPYRVFNHSGQIEIFLVELGEDKLFQKLIGISNQTVQELKQRSREFGHAEGEQKGFKKGVESMRSWYNTKGFFGKLIHLFKNI